MSSLHETHVSPLMEKTHGWTAVPVDATKLLNGKDFLKKPDPLRVADIPIPQSALCRAVHEYAKKELPEETFNHSMRVFHFGSCPRLLRAHSCNHGPSADRVS